MNISEIHKFIGGAIGGRVSQCTAGLELMLCVPSLYYAYNSDDMRSIHSRVLVTCIGGKMATENEVQVAYCAAIAMEWEEGIRLLWSHKTFEGS